MINRACPDGAFDTATLCQTGARRACTETIAGQPQQPINLLVTARQAHDLVDGHRQHAIRFRRMQAAR